MITRILVTRLACGDPAELEPAGSGAGAETVGAGVTVARPRSPRWRGGAASGGEQAAGKSHTRHRHRQGHGASEPAVKGHFTSIGSRRGRSTHANDVEENPSLAEVGGQRPPIVLRFDAGREG